MDNSTLKKYKQLRRTGWPATCALRNARTIVEWDHADGYTVAAYEAPCEPDQYGHPGRVRLVERPDDMGYDASFVDTWDETEAKKEKIKTAIYERCNRDGVWGYVAEVWDGAQWVDADSIWGFIGTDFEGSGYDTDLMRAALDALGEYLIAAAREIEGTRPDMYVGASHG